jgi:hypothetical protein
MPSRRKKPAPTRRAVRAPAPTQLELGRRATSEPGDVGRADDDGIDPGAFKLEHVALARDRRLRYGELARRHVLQEAEDVLERVRLDRAAGREQKDFRVDSIERELKLVLVPDLDNAVEAELEHFGVEFLEPSVFLLEAVDREQTSIRAGLARVLGRPELIPEDRKLGRFTHSHEPAAQDDSFRSMRARGPGGLDVLDIGEEGDPVSFGNRLAEAARPSHRNVGIVSPAAGAGGSGYR